MFTLLISAVITFNTDEPADELILIMIFLFERRLLNIIFAFQIVKCFLTKPSTKEISQRFFKYCTDALKCMFTEILS